jgi:hypothetical protein
MQLVKHCHEVTAFLTETKAELGLRRILYPEADWELEAENAVNGIGQLNGFELSRTRIVLQTLEDEKLCDFLRSAQKGLAAVATFFQGLRLRLFLDLHHQVPHPELYEIVLIFSKSFLMVRYGFYGTM